MNYLSLFSGIEAASVAWHDFGWTCVGVSEIDPFPCAVLNERFPNVPNLGDITQITKERLDELKEKHGTIDIVVGGSPCQSFSVAGKRLGLEDPRGNLMFEYCRVVRTVRPKYFIWENVPGALSSGKGRDFGSLIGEMVDIGYSLCWRVLDAQYFGVPQRRRRVFLVGCLGKNTSSFEVLFEQDGCPRNLNEGRKARKDNSTQVESGIGEHVDREDEGVVYHSNHRGTPPKEHDKCPTLLAWMGTGGNNVPMTLEKSVTFLESSQPHATMGDVEVCSTLTASMGLGGGHVPMIVDMEYYYYNQTSGDCTGPDPVAGTLLARYGTGGGNVPFVMEHHSYNITFNDANGTRKDRPNGGCYINEVTTSNAITCGGVGDTKIVECTPCDLYNTSVDESGTTSALTTQSNAIGSGPRLIEIRVESKVRRLTPLECERLQGFPDKWTEIAYKGKEAKDCPTSPRYKALGNSMAVPVMRFIGLGILEVENKL